MQYKEGKYDKGAKKIGVIIFVGWLLVWSWNAVSKLTNKHIIQPMEQSYTEEQEFKELGPMEQESRCRQRELFDKLSDRRKKEFLEKYPEPKRCYR